MQFEMPDTRFQVAVQQSLQLRFAMLEVDHQTNVAFVMLLRLLDPVYLVQFCLRCPALFAFFRCMLLPG